VLGDWSAGSIEDWGCASSLLDLGLSKGGKTNAHVLFS